MAATPPQIVSRASWGANPLVTPAGTIKTPSEELWLHHTAGEQFGAAGMRMLQAFTLHRPDEHYVDLEYTFVFDDNSGEIFESRGVGKNTAATGGRRNGIPWPQHNNISHAICVMGNFQNDTISDAAIETLANLVAWGYEQGWWGSGLTGGHRDASGNATACPGDHLESQVARINARAAQIHTGTPTPAPGPTPTPTPSPAAEEDDMRMIFQASGKPLRLELENGKFTQIALDEVHLFTDAKTHVVIRLRPERYDAILGDT